ncbi:MAG: M20/M25/M40 family metallo-hydrolase, partial [Burkholderiales bacterium]|nr:M20/M25/M40 family metallo-hydrolase [Burkholderiales bacterium]
WLRVISRGDSGHGSTPHDNNAVDHLVRALDRLLDSEPRAEMSPPVAEMMRRNSRLQEFPNSFFSARADQWPFEAIVLRSMKDLSPRTRSMTRNSCSLTGLSAGIKTNVIPSEASAVLDCRLLPTEDPEAFKAKLLETLGEGDLELEVIMQSQSGPVTDWNTPLFAAIEEAVLKHYPEAVVAPYMSSGFTDSAFFRRKGIKAYGFIPFVLNRDEIKGFHNVDERVPVDSFRNAIPIFYDILERFAQTP